MIFTTALRALLAALVLLSLSPADASATLLDQREKTRALTFAVKALMDRQVLDGAQKRECMAIFVIYGFKVVDARMFNDEMEVDLSYTVRSQYPLAPGSRAAAECYGEPPEGWRSGQPVMLVETFRFDQWNTAFTPRLKGDRLHPQGFVGGQAAVALDDVTECAGTAGATECGAQATENAGQEPDQNSADHINVAHSGGPDAASLAWLNDLSVFSRPIFREHSVASVEEVFAILGPVQFELICPPLANYRELEMARGARLRIERSIDPWTQPAVMNRLFQAAHTQVRRRCPLGVSHDQVYVGLGSVELLGPDEELLIYGRSVRLWSDWQRVSSPERDSSEAAARVSAEQVQSDRAPQKAQVQPVVEPETSDGAAALLIVGLAVIAAFALFGGLFRGSGSYSYSSSGSDYDASDHETSYESEGQRSSTGKARSKPSGFVSSSETREEWHRRGQAAAKEGRGHDEPWHTDITEPDRHYEERRAAFRKGRESHYRDKDRRR